MGFMSDHIVKSVKKDTFLTIKGKTKKMNSRRGTQVPKPVRSFYTCQLTQPNIHTRGQPCWHMPSFRNKARAHVQKKRAALVSNESMNAKSRTELLKAKLRHCH